MRVAPTFKIQWLLATLHNTRWMHYWAVCHGSNEAIPILDPVNVKEAYSHITTSYHWQKKQQHHHCPILGMSFNRVSWILSFSSWVIYVLIGCSHSLMRYLQPLDRKTSTTWSLPNPEIERQWRVDNFESCIFGNPGITLIFGRITVLLTTLIGKNTINQR